MKFPYDPVAANIFSPQVPLLSSMDAYERSQLADALKVENFKKDDKIITEGEPGDKFYILEEPPDVDLWGG